MLELSHRLSELVAKTKRDFNALNDSHAAAPAVTGGWSRKQILGHLIDSASNNHQRFVRALLQDELRFPSYDQPGCVRVQNYQDLPWAELLGLWSSYNLFLAHVLAGIPPEKLSTPCRIGDYPEMTLQELATDYLTHMQHHIEQL